MKKFDLEAIHQEIMERNIRELNEAYQAFIEKQRAQENKNRKGTNN